MQPSSLTPLCRTTSDPHAVLEEIKRGTTPDYNTLNAACQRTAQVYEAWQHLIRCRNRQGQIRLPQAVFIDGIVCYLALWERVIDRLIDIGATIDGGAIESMKQNGLQELAEKVRRALAPAKKPKTP